MENKINKFICWTPRILSIVFICFLALFSLDIFDMELSLWETILGLFMHNIPVFVLLAILLISWKHEIVGGIVFILFGILYASRMLLIALINPLGWHMLFWSLPISGPAFLVGILFIIGWIKKKKQL